jgi:hypothetical protein
VGKALAQLAAKTQPAKQGLKDDEAGKGRQVLIFATKLWNPVDTAEDLCFPEPHRKWPPGSGLGLDPEQARFFG